MHSIQHLTTVLRNFIRHAGHTKAGYYLNEEAALAVGQPRAGHYSRRNAAHALRRGCAVTLDLGYNGCLQFDGTVTVRLSEPEGVLVEVVR